MLPVFFGRKWRKKTTFSSSGVGPQGGLLCSPTRLLGWALAGFSLLFIFMKLRVCPARVQVVSARWSLPFRIDEVGFVVLGIVSLILFTSGRRPRGGLMLSGIASSGIYRLLFLLPQKGQGVFGCESAESAGVGYPLLSANSRLKS